MEQPIIEIKNIGKKYNITHQRGGYVALRDVLMNIIKAPFVFLKSKAKQVAGLETKEEFWALKDVSFNVNKGEVIGIIGSNGAGKSTLLKILSQITPPTTGEIKIRGRVGSLLEVGTGFHPELSGRENIFLNGAILGMSKKEIIDKFDAIVEFSGIEKFLDTPVKHYSSGMYVRLAFSVAAHMEPDILIIDEVLAVGDFEFQKKCLGKMDQITKQDQRTIIFVSHNMTAVQNLCHRTIVLKKGQVKFIGKTKEAIDYYTKKDNLIEKNDSPINHKHSTDDISIESYQILKNDRPAEIFSFGDSLTLKIKINARGKYNKVAFEVLIKDQNNYPIIFLPSGLRFNTEFSIEKGITNLSCKIPFLPLAKGRYYIDLILANSGNSFYDYIENALSFSIDMSDPLKINTCYSQDSGQGAVHIDANFYKE